jgi:hypothetical protein
MVLPQLIKRPTVYWSRADIITKTFSISNNVIVYIAHFLYLLPVSSVDVQPAYEIVFPPYVYMHIKTNSSVAQTW